MGSKPARSKTAAPRCAEAKELVRLSRISYADIAPRFLAALECAFNRLDGSSDPRVSVLTESDISEIEVTVVDPAPPCALVSSPKRNFSTLCLFFSEDALPHHSMWWPISSYFFNVSGRLPRDPSRALHALSPAELAALAVRFRQKSVEEALAHFHNVEPADISAVDVAPVGVEAALLRNFSGTRSLFINHNGIWWPALLIRKPLYRKPAPLSRAEEGFNFPLTAIV